MTQPIQAVQIYYEHPFGAEREVLREFFSFVGCLVKTTMMPVEPITRDLGFMPLTPDYTKKYDPDLVCRHLTIENGVIEYTKGDWFRCYESSVSAG